VVASSTPILAESWKNKDHKNIIHIYSKSTLNLLIAGFFLFGCMWINMHNMPHIFPAEYKIEKTLILVMAIYKLIDLGTGLNAHVIATSNFWKFEFYTTIIVSILALFINGLLIKNIGLMGAAYGTLITTCIYNLTRFIFLWAKFGLQPFSWKNLLLLFVAAASIYIFSFLPVLGNWVLDGIYRCLIFAVIYIGLIWVLNISDDLKVITRAVLRKVKLIK
jgi:O-antigen/teichoic acid export membrane protein